MNLMPADLYRIFCENVNDRLSELGWSRADLASKMDVTIAYVTNYLNGHRRPGIDVIARFAKALRVEADTLLKNFAKN